MSKQNVLRRALVALPLIAFLVLVYWPAPSGPFVFDDAYYIPQTRVETFDLAALREAARNHDSSIFGRPLPAATFALSYRFGDGTPVSFKITNQALRALNGGLVFLLCLLSLRRVQTDFSNERGDKPVHALALLVAVAWTFHSLQVSTAVYTVLRMTLPMSGFSLVALILYIRLREAQICRASGGTMSSPSTFLTGIVPEQVSPLHYRDTRRGDRARLGERH